MAGQIYLSCDCVCGGSLLVPVDPLTLAPLADTAGCSICAEAGTPEFELEAVAA